MNGPDSVPDGAPDSMPDGASESMPQGAPDIGPDNAPDLGPDNPSDVGPSADPEIVRFTSRPTTSDIVWNAAAVIRESVTGLAFGAFITTQAAVPLILFRDPILILGVALGLSFLTGLFVAPFVWWSVRMRRDLTLAPVEVVADGQGVEMVTSQSSSRQDWSVFRRVRETQRAFMLETGMLTVFLTKQGVDKGDIERFRGLLRERGLLGGKDSRFGRIRRIVWIGVGVAAAAALFLVPLALSGFGATATLDLSATVSGREIRLEGTTDLPDGAVLYLEVTQLDEWERAIDSYASDPSEWVRGDDVRVAGGRFERAIAVDGWPAGRAVATAYFWVDESQPKAVTDRFGVRGGGLRGPDVYADGDYVSLVVEREFRLP